MPNSHSPTAQNREPENAAGQDRQEQWVKCSKAQVRVVHGHSDLLPADDYHQWVNLGGRVKADVNGRPNPRMYATNWSRWICNNFDCAGEVLVHDDAVLALIETAL